MGCWSLWDCMPINGCLLIVCFLEWTSFRFMKVDRDGNGCVTKKIPRSASNSRRATTRILSKNLFFDTGDVMLQY